MYTLDLTRDEVDAIRFVASRGYAVAVLDAIGDPRTLHGRSPDMRMHLFTIPEHLAWAVAEEERDNGGHGFGPVPEALTRKLYAFVDGIV